MDQPELDLPRPVARPRPRRSIFAGLSAAQLGVGVAGVALLVWAMWVTRALLTPEPDRLVSARISEIVGEYVQAEARSTAPPAQVEAEMLRFMGSLDSELQRRSSSGQVVLVGEAVLTKNVPDITEALKRAVYGAGLPRPRPDASAMDNAPPPPAGGLPAATAPAPSPFADVPDTGEGDGVAAR